MEGHVTACPFPTTGSPNGNVCEQQSVRGRRAENDKSANRHECRNVLHLVTNARGLKLAWILLFLSPKNQKKSWKHLYLTSTFVESLSFKHHCKKAREVYLKVVLSIQSLQNHQSLSDRHLPPMCSKRKVKCISKPT